MLYLEERERLQNIRSKYYKELKQAYLTMDDVKSIGGSDLFLAIIDYCDSKKFRDNSTFIFNTFFPKSVIIGNIDGKIYDFNGHMFLDMNKYIINYALMFSELVDDSYWNFLVDDDRILEVITRYSSLENTKDFVFDEFTSKKMVLNMERYELFDIKAKDKVLRKER